MLSLVLVKLDSLRRKLLQRNHNIFVGVQLYPRRSKQSLWQSSSWSVGLAWSGKCCVFRASAADGPAGCAAAQRDLERLGETGGRSLMKFSKGSATFCKSFFPKRWGNNPFRLTVLLQVTFLKKHTNKIMVGWSLTGFKMFLIIL